MHATIAEDCLEWLDALVMHLDVVEGVRESCLTVAVLGARGVPRPTLRGEQPLTPHRWRVTADGQAHAMVCTLYETHSRQSNGRRRHRAWRMVAHQG